MNIKLSVSCQQAASIRKKKKKSLTLFKTQSCDIGKQSCYPQLRLIMTQRRKKSIFTLTLFQTQPHNHWKQSHCPWPTGLMQKKDYTVLLKAVAHPFCGRQIAFMYAPLHATIFNSPASHPDITIQADWVQNTKLLTYSPATSAAIFCLCRST